ILLGRIGGAGAHDLMEPVANVIVMNIGLACFNLIPCPPLDGGAVLRGLLPRDLEFITDGLERIGFMLLFALVMSGALRYLMHPAYVLAGKWLMTISGWAAVG